jgi:hypothetical protein
VEGRADSRVVACVAVARWMALPRRSRIGRSQSAGRRAGSFKRAPGGLRDAMRRQLPLIYFHGIVPGRYMASWPVYIVGDEPGALTFRVAVDDRQLAVEGAQQDSSEVEIRRRYVTRLVRQPLHQQTFRERVLAAYREHCAICRLRHQELLEAAHIGDADPEVSRGWRTGWRCARRITPRLTDASSVSGGLRGRGALQRPRSCGWALLKHGFMDSTARV